MGPADLRLLFRMTDFRAAIVQAFEGRVKVAAANEEAEQFVDGTSFEENVMISTDSDVCGYLKHKIWITSLKFDDWECEYAVMNELSSGLYGISLDEGGRHLIRLLSSMGGNDIGKNLFEIGIVSVYKGICSLLEDEMELSDITVEAVVEKLKVTEYKVFENRVSFFESA